MYKKWTEVISKTPLFKDISSDELGTMLECLKPRVCEYTKNEFIAIEGEKFEGIGIILTGEAAVIKENYTGNRVIMTVLKPGDMFGEMAAFSTRKLWPATVLAQVTCTAFFIPPQTIVGECRKMCTGHRMLILNMLKIISEKAFMLNRKVEYLAIKSMRGKISAFLLEQYRKARTLTFMIPLSRSEMADFLNVSRPSMSREMGRMKDEGIIDFCRSSIRIIDLEALKGFVSD
jgi:CRP-like cAMP-binding protein